MAGTKRESGGDYDPEGQAKAAKVSKIEDDDTNDEQEDGAATPRTSGAGLVIDALKHRADPNSRRGTLVIYVAVREDDPRFIDGLRHCRAACPGETRRDDPICVRSGGWHSGKAGYRSYVI